MNASCPLQSRTLRDVARWWVRAYREKGLPSRDDIDLKAIRFALPFVWLVEYVAGEDGYRYRLAGEHINTTFGFSLRGKWLQQILEPHILPTVRARYEHALKTPGAVYAVGRVYMRTGGHREGERLILPLSDDGIGGTHLLGVTDYGSGRQPHAEPSPPEYMEEKFLSLDDVSAWRADLEADLVQPTAPGRTQTYS